MRHYATLFDRAYLAKGLVMLNSLGRYSTQSYRLHILALDRETEYALREFGYAESMYTVETFREFPYFPPRPWREFCWTLASQFTEYIMARYRLDRSGFDSVTYLDSDMMFFADPEPVFSEIGNRSIGVVEHRLIPCKRHLAVNGRFNVAFNYFQNNSTGRDCLSTWAAQVRERCDASTCGDQQYLDFWPARYGAECHVVQHIGANVAPWNLANYRVTAGPCVDGERVLWFHFHEYEHGVRLTNYDLRPEDIQLIYEPYIAAMNVATAQIECLQAHC